jgi:antitoxin ParD1/3/4
MEPLTVTITPEMADRIKEAVATGQYASASEVVRDALQEWELSRQRRERALDELRAEIEKGLADIEAGRLVDLDAEEIIAQGRQLLAARNSHSG